MTQGECQKCRSGILDYFARYPVQILGDNTPFSPAGASCCAFNRRWFLYRADCGYAERRLSIPGCSVSRRFLWVSVFALIAWLGLSYGLRYGLMEDVRWVGACSDDGQQWQCVVRDNLGLLIHFGVFGWGALITSLVAFFVPRSAGRMLAVIALMLGMLALVLYTASLAVFAVVIAGLRLVRAR